MSTVGATEARKSIPGLIEQARRGPVTIVRRGQPQAVVVSPQLYERMRDALEELEDITAFDEAMREEGANIPWEQVKADLGWE